MKKQYHLSRKWTLFLFLFGVAIQYTYGQLTLDISKTNPTCIGGDGSITATVSGGSSPYTYVWTGPSGFSGQGTNGVTGPAGTYTLTVTDATTPTALTVLSGDIIITDPDLITVTASVTEPYECGAGNGGAFNVIVTGGNYPVLAVEESGTPVTPTGRYVDFTYGGPAVSNYQVRLTVPWSTGMPTDFDRVWFTGTDGTALSYWRESVTDGVEAVYWVLLPEMIVGNNTLYIYSNDALNTVDDPNYGFTKVFNQGGLNVTIFSNSDFTGTETFCADVNTLTVLNKVWTGGNIDMAECFSGYDTDGLSIRWEGWFVPPTGATWYGVRTNGQTTNGVNLYLNGAEVISTNSISFTTINQTFSGDPVTGYPAIRYDYYHTGGTDDGYAQLGWASSEPLTFGDLTLIPRSSYYYHTVVANPPTTFTYGDRYEGLAAGTYNFTVVDGSCGGSFPGTTISGDSDDPQLNGLPDNCQITDMTTFNSGNLSDVELLNTHFPNLNGWTDDDANDRIYPDPLLPEGLVFQGSATTAYTDFVTYNVPNVSFYKNITLALAATQSGDAGYWDAGDAISIGYSTDYGGTWTTASSSTGYVSGGILLSQELTNVPADRVNNPDPSLLVRIYFSTLAAGSDRSYKVTGFTITADQAVHLVPLDCGGPQPTCSDNTSCSVTYTDGPVKWSCYDDATPDNNEFSFTRTWVATDPCGKTATHNQLISVGTPPVLDMSANGALTYDFCHNVFDAVDYITAPTASDACSSGAGEIIISYAVTDNEGGLEVGSGTGNINNLTFPNSSTGDKVYTITWTATDEAGLTDVETQQVTIKRVISATLVADSEELGKLCAEENIAFTITPVGGTGIYNSDGFTFTPSGGSWSWDNGSGTGQYTISWAAATSSTKVTVVIIDADDTTNGITGGCSNFDEQSSTDFIVHKLLQTGEIKRN